MHKAEDLRRSSDIMKKVYLVRHAKTIMNYTNRWQGRSDSDILPGAIEKLLSSIKSIENEGINKIYSSCIGRAIKSAAAAANVLGLNSIFLDCRFNERDLGLLEGKTVDEIRTKFGIEFLYITSRDIEKLPYVESWPDFVSRVFSGLESLPDGRTLLITHGGVLRAVYNTLSHSDERRVIFDNGDILVLNKTDSWDIERIIK